MCILSIITINQKPHQELTSPHFAREIHCMSKSATQSSKSSPTKNSSEATEHVAKLSYSWLLANARLSPSINMKVGDSSVWRLHDYVSRYSTSLVLGYSQILLLTGRTNYMGGSRHAVANIRRCSKIVTLNYYNYVYIDTPLWMSNLLHLLVWIFHLSRSCQGIRNDDIRSLLTGHVDSQHNVEARDLGEDGSIDNTQTINTANTEITI